MTDAKPARPLQVTVAAGAVIVGSVLLVLFAFDQMTGLGSIEAQEAAEKFVSTSPGSGLGLTADGVQSLLRVLCVVAGGAAAASAILGWQALQRSRSARLALSLVAPVLLVAGYAAADLLAMLIVGATVLLWVQPSRDWFAGREPARPARVQAAAHAARPAPPGPAHQPGPGPLAGDVPPSAYAPPSAPPSALPPGAPPAMSPPVAWPGPHPTYAVETRRPTAVTTACVVTIVTSAVTAVTMLAALVVILGDRATFESEIAKEMAGNAAYDGLDSGVLIGVLVGMVVVFVLWALVAIVLAVLTLRGSNAARITLIVSSFAAAAASVLGVLVVVPLLVGATAVGVAVMLLRREVTTWFATRRGRRHPAG